jgi:hypothetical protein
MDKRISKTIDHAINPLHFFKPLRQLPAGTPPTFF